MKYIREYSIWIAALVIIFFIIILNVYSVSQLKSEVYENHYAEEANLMVDGIERFFISERSEELEQLVNKEVVIEALKCKDDESCNKLESYMIDVDEYIDYKFIAVFDKNRNKLFVDSSDNVDENSILEAYKNLYIDNFTGIIIELPLERSDLYENDMFFRKNIIDDGEILGSILLATDGKSVIEFMNHFDEKSYILDPSGNIYIASEIPNIELSNFLRLNNKNELDMQGRRSYKNSYFDVFDLDNAGWKIVIMQSLTQVKLSTRISVLMGMSHFFSLVLIILFLLIARMQKIDSSSKKQLETLTSALKKTESKISIVREDSEIIYSNHEDFKLIYQNPDNLYFKSDILSAIRKERNFEKRYSFNLDGQKKWFVLHLNTLDVYESCSCAVISLNEFTNERLYQKQLESMALYDKLTGCYSREAGLDKINDIRNDKSVSELTIIFLDIDDLKYVNDNMGHNMGDLLIRSVINVVKDSVRSNDYCVRIGGDEFLLVLPNCSYLRATEIILLIEDQVSTIRLPEYSHKPSFSFGIVTKINEDTLDMDSMINEADAKMYINKKIKKGKINKYPLI